MNGNLSTKSSLKAKTYVEGKNKDSNVINVALAGLLVELASFLGTRGESHEQEERNFGKQKKRASLCHSNLLVSYFFFFFFA
jgi:hypothetical protein